MNVDWVTIETDNDLIIQIDPESIEVPEDSAEISCDVAVFSKDGSPLNQETYQDEVNKTVSKFFNTVLENAIETLEQE